MTNSLYFYYFYEVTRRKAPDSGILTVQKPRGKRTGRDASDRGILKVRNAREWIQKYKENILSFSGRPTNITDRPVQKIYQGIICIKTDNTAKEEL